MDRLWELTKGRDEKTEGKNLGNIKFSGKHGLLVCMDMDSFLLLMLLSGTVSLTGLRTTGRDGEERGTGRERLKVESRKIREKRWELANFSIFYLCVVELKLIIREKEGRQRNSIPNALLH